MLGEIVGISVAGWISKFFIEVHRSSRFPGPLTVVQSGDVVEQCINKIALGDRARDEQYRPIAYLVNKRQHGMPLDLRESFTFERPYCRCEREQTELMEQYLLKNGYVEKASWEKMPFFERYTTGLLENIVGKIEKMWVDYLNKQNIDSAIPKQEAYLLTPKSIDLIKKVKSALDEISVTDCGSKGPITLDRLNKTEGQMHMQDVIIGAYLLQRDISRGFVMHPNGESCRHELYPDMEGVIWNPPFEPLWIVEPEPIQRDYLGNSVN